MTFHFEYEALKKLDFDYESLIEKVILAVLDYENCPYEVEVNIVLTDNQEIHKINREFRQTDRPTDVLSFPVLEYEVAGDFSKAEEDMSVFHPETGELLLGDIMISVDKIIEQATEYGHSIERELGFLVAHSMLHLCGYDHILDDERKIMEAKQNEIMERLSLYRWKEEE